MKIFLTGGTGFIGSHFINKAMAANLNLICLRRKGSQSRISLNKEPVWVEGELDDDWSAEFKKCDLLVHLAAHSTNVPYDTLENCLYLNMTVPLRLFQSARESGIRKFIIAGTGFEYGLSGEEYDFIPVEASLKPTMSYPASKAASSIVFYQWAIENNLKLKYLRIFQIFGEGETEQRLWPSLKKAALEGKDYHLTLGEQIRDFTPVEELADQILIETDFSNEKNGVPIIKNVGTDHPQSIKEFAESWWKKWNATGKLYFGSKPYRENEVMRFVPEIQNN